MRVVGFRRDSRVVDQNIHPIEFALGSLRNLSGYVRIAKVADHESMPGTRQQRKSLLGQIPPRPTVHCDPIPLRRKSKSDRSANAPRRARDQHTPPHANTCDESRKALNSNAFPAGSYRNIVHCSAGKP